MDFVGMWPGLNVSAITTGSSVLNNLLVLPAAVSTLLFPCYLLFIQAITCRLGGFFGRGKQLPGASPDSFVAWERPVALRKLLCNIGPTGCAVAGAGPGVIVASPSKHDPDYFYTWTRDAALVSKSLVDLLGHGYNSSIQGDITQYITSQARLQSIHNPSGSLNDGAGLGEPKFNVDATVFSGPWGRPQRDGPALRAVALIAYARWLVENGYSSTAERVVWPTVHNDLSYVAQYWNHTGFDLWEEVDGSSFFTVASQHRALVEGSGMGRTLGIPCSACDAIAPQVLCFLQTFWSPQDEFIIANFASNGRTGKDANTILASIHTFDPDAGCDATTFQPCSDKALANHRAVVDSFRVYPLNRDAPVGTAIAVGRYAEDVYYGGNPWYLATLAAAEQLYDALYVWKRTGSITVTPTSLDFFRDLAPWVDLGDYFDTDPDFIVLCDAVFRYADGFLNVVEKYVGPEGSMAEQFDKSNGQPRSARDLTWSYAAFLTAAARREGAVPPSWGLATGKPALLVPFTARAHFEDEHRDLYSDTETIADFLGRVYNRDKRGCYL